MDDCIGVWRGTKRSFDHFVHQLNSETKKYGIEFPITEVQFGKSVHFLDLCVYLDDNNSIQYKSYSKPTDSKRYLNPNSFHPKSVFTAIPFSQFLRTLRNNSRDENTREELELCAQHFVNSGYGKEILLELKQKAIDKSNQPNTISREQETLVFPVHYFDGVRELQKVIRSLQNELASLIGDVRIMFAMKKRSSIGNNVVRNKQLSLKECDTNNQRCNAGGCRQCPAVINAQKLSINNNQLTIPKSLNCKSKNVVYFWQCNLCTPTEAYFGRTTQECRDRSSGHRSCFNDESKWEKSALSMHAREKHRNDFSLENFSVAVVKKVSPQNLRREEFRFIEKYKTIPFGLNRYKV